MIRIIHHANFASILPYIRTDIGNKPNTNEIFTFDTNQLSLLGASVRTNPQEFQLLLDAMSIRDGVIMIPDYILLECNRNIQNPGHFQSLYSDLFKILSQYADIFIVSFDEIFDLVAAGASNVTEAFTQFQLVAQQLNITNDTIASSIKQATTVNDIEMALTTSTQDAGERVLHQLVCALLIDGVPKVHMFSNEIKGVFNIRKLASQDETLREILRFNSQEEFLQSFVLQSFDCVLSNTLKTHKSVWPKAMHQAFIDRHRIAQYKGRKVRFMLTSAGFSELATLSNSEFVDLIYSNDSAVITY